MSKSKPSDNDRGLHEKYHVVRTDGQSGFGGKHYQCSYFVLDLDHDPFALAALKAYEKACRKTYPTLAKDIKAQIGHLS